MEHTQQSHDDPLGTETHMCEPCSQVRFDSLSLPKSHSAKALTVSTINSTMVNIHCPLCRLITCYIRSSPNAHTLPGTTEVSLRLIRGLYAARSSQAVNIPQGEQPLHLYIHLCSRKAQHQSCHPDSSAGRVLPIIEGQTHHFQRGDSFGSGSTFQTPKHGSLVYARKLPDSVDAGLLREWMSFCTDHHDHSRNEGVDTAIGIETRLIDVQKRCLVNSTLQEKYLALSYVWGNGAKPLLTTQTLEFLYCEASLTADILPKLLLDVMDLVVRLGERYLWIDNACIIQDDIYDKQRQLPVMDSIYRNATLTIVATGPGADLHLPRWKASETEHVSRVRCRTEGLVENLHGIPFTNSLSNLSAALSQTVWNSRGWTFQEGMLAKRALIFTDCQVYWNCPEESWCEAEHTEFQNIRHLPNEENSLLDSLHYQECPDHQEVEEWTHYCPLAVYMQKVQEYTRRQFTDYTDVLWAFLGILKQMKSWFPKGYIWGLSFDRLDTALLWFQCCPQRLHVGHFLPVSDGTLKCLPIPSWSWLAKGHGVVYGSCPDSAIISRVDWHEPISYHGNYDLGTTYHRLAESNLPIFVGEGAPTLDSNLFSFALLCFTGETASLDIEIDSQAKRSRGHDSVNASIVLPCGRKVGQIPIVPEAVCPCCRKLDAEFVLLSIDTGKRRVQHVFPDGTLAPEPEFNPQANIMLIKWNETESGAPWAVRMGISAIDEADWNSLERTKKKIVLG